MKDRKQRKTLTEFEIRIKDSDQIPEEQFGYKGNGEKPFTKEIEEDAKDLVRYLNDNLPPTEPKAD
jgi:hypothetical protein